MTVRNDVADVDSLVRYIEDIKPYHSKLTEVEVEYQWSECFAAEITEEYSQVLDVSSLWEYEFVSNGRRTGYRIPATLFPRETAPIHQVNQVAGTDDLDVRRVLHYVTNNFIFTDWRDSPAYLSQVPAWTVFDELELVPLDHLDLLPAYWDLPPYSPSSGAYLWGIETGAYAIPSNNGLEVHVDGILQVRDVDYILQKNRTIVQFLTPSVPPVGAKLDFNLYQLDRIFIKITPPGDDPELTDWVPYILDGLSETGDAGDPIAYGAFDVSPLGQRFIGNETWVAIPFDAPPGYTAEANDIADMGQTFSAYDDTLEAYVPFGLVRAIPDPDQNNLYWIWEFYTAPEIDSTITLRIEQRETYGTWAGTAIEERLDIADIHEFDDTVLAFISDGLLGAGLEIISDNVYSDTANIVISDSDLDTQYVPDAHLSATASITEEFAIALEYNFYDDITTWITDSPFGVYEHLIGHGVAPYDVIPFDQFDILSNISIERPDVDAMSSVITDEFILSVTTDGVENISKHVTINPAVVYVQDDLIHDLYVKHNLGYQPVVDCAVGGSPVIPDQVEHINNDNIVHITFNIPIVYDLTLT